MSRLGFGFFSLPRLLQTTLVTPTLTAYTVWPVHYTSSQRLNHMIAQCTPLLFRSSDWKEISKFDTQFERLTFF
jgi:hypothetical protein